MLKWIIGVLLLAVSAHAQPITYQGRLDDNGTAADGLYDFQFFVFDAGGSPLSAGIGLDDVPVTDGVFSVELDFFGYEYDVETWLEIAVRDAASDGPFDTLNPRQPVRPAPAAIEHITEPWRRDGNVLVADPSATQIVVNRSAPTTADAYYTLGLPTGASTVGGMVLITDDPTGLPYLALSAGDTGPSTGIIVDGGTGETFIANDGGGVLVFSPEGDIGIGELNPQSTLDVSGDGTFSGPLVAQDLTYTDPRTRTMSFPGSAFGSSSHDRSVSISGSARVFDSRSTILDASVNFPDGATVTGVTFHVRDDSAANDLDFLRLLRIDFTTGSAQQLAGASSAGLTGLNAIPANLSSSFLLEIDNSRYGYYLSAGNLWDGDIFLLGATIEYSVSKPD